MIDSISLVVKEEMKDGSKHQCWVYPRINAGYFVDKRDGKVLEGTFEA